MTDVVIVGAGPAGLLAAAYLMARPNNRVVIYEKRGDFSSTAFQGDRTFPIALQNRGLAAIRGIPGLESALDGPCNEKGDFRGVWTVGMSLHRERKERKISRPPMLSVERNHIASTFLKELRKIQPAENSSLAIHFDTALVGADVSNKKLRVKKSNKEEEEAVSYDVLIGCDGARSMLRNDLKNQGLMEFQQTKTSDEYKSFYVLRSSKDEMVKLDGDRIHGWMFGDQRVISVPTRAHESAGVFIFPEGKDPFSNLPHAEAVLEYIRSLSPSLASLVTMEEAECLRTRPVASTVEVTCDRLTVGKDIVLLGDASHAVSASLGQGCNSALQDVQVLMGCLDQCKGDWVKALSMYNQERLPEAHAVWELSAYNNPRSKWMRLEFLARMILTSLLPKWLSDVLLRPMPGQLLSDGTLSYSDVLARSRWWIDRVKRSG